MAVWSKSTSVHLTVDPRPYESYTHTHTKKTNQLAELASFARLVTVIGFQLQEKFTAIVCVCVCAHALVCASVI